MIDTPEQNHLITSIVKFKGAFKIDASTDDIWRSLQKLYEQTVGCRLFTVMTADMRKMEARRIFTNRPKEYPVSGTKSIHMDIWFDCVHHQRKLFVANTIAEIAKVFPDHQKIWSMGCGSVVNVPVIILNELVATINILDVEHHYTHARLEIIEEHLRPLSLQTYEAVRHTN